MCKEAKHNVFTHFPKCPGCDICDATKMQKTSARIVTGKDPEDRPPPAAFGDMLTADHKVMAQDEISKAGDKYALVIVDRFTKWLQAFPCKTKATPEAKSMFQILNSLQIQQLPLSSAALSHEICLDPQILNHIYLA